MGVYRYLIVIILAQIGNFTIPTTLTAQAGLGAFQHLADLLHMGQLGIDQSELLVCLW